MEERKETVPVVILRGIVLLPDIVTHFDISQADSIRAVETALSEKKEIFLIAQNDLEAEKTNQSVLYEIGILAEVKQAVKMPGNIVRVIVEGTKRARLLQLLEADEFLQAEVDVIEEEAEFLPDEVQEAMLRSLQETLQRYVRLVPKTGKEFVSDAEKETDLKKLMSLITTHISLRYDRKQRLLEAKNLEERYETLMAFLLNEINILTIKNEFQKKLKDQVDKNQKEYLLREQMKLIRKELGEDTIEADVRQYQEQLKKLKAPKAVKEKIKKEISRFQNFGSSSAESSVSRSYIETLLELPWEKASKEQPDLKQAEAVMQADHYGMQDVKERILEFLAVRSLTECGDTPVICLVGPPGTGKTSIARSVAKALKKEYVRISLGGVRDEAEIRGHRRTYVGAMPGRIVMGLRNAGVKNPLMLLDEIDKVGSDYKGDPAAALLEVLDGEQNRKFRDNYVEIPVDLSDVLFIATANSAQDIPKPLLDRMEVIEVSSYTSSEKLHIAKEHLLARQMERNGLKEGQLLISQKALQKMISGYTKEAGVRNLERKIGSVCRKAARVIYSGKKKSVRINEKNLSDYLGKEKYSEDEMRKTNEVGIVHGLAWTSVGGVVLEIEVNVMPGSGTMKLTGQMGDVMKESAETGLSYIRSVMEQHGVDAEWFQKQDIHIHIPEGAVPKDGPSAGITMATAVLSALTNTKVCADVAMTGEITLRGRVLPIGGLKEKLLAAKNAGMKTVCVPAQNQKDVEEISDEITRGMEIVYVKQMDEVVKTAFWKE
ncbi:MAG: endopeptidase La [Lachnospiraceae bacterium]